MALGRLPGQKYESGRPSEQMLRSCFELLDELGKQGLILSPAVERLRLLNQVIMNVLLHNPDAHLKNYALLLQDNGLIRVSPMYDVLCTHGLNFESSGGAWTQDPGSAAHTLDMSLRIGNAVPIDQISGNDWDQFATECGFTAAFVRRRIGLLAEILRDNMTGVTDSVISGQPAAEAAATVVAGGINKQLKMVLKKT